MWSDYFKVLNTEQQRMFISNKIINLATYLIKLSFWWGLKELDYH